MLALGRETNSYDAGDTNACSLYIYKELICSRNQKH